MPHQISRTKNTALYQARVDMEMVEFLREFWDERSDSATIARALRREYRAIKARIERGEELVGGETDA